MSNSLGNDLRAIARRRGREDLIDQAMAMPPVFSKEGGWSGDGLAYLLARNEEVFDARFDRRYRHAELTDPRIITWIELNQIDPIAHAHLLLMGDTGVGKTYNLHGAIKRLIAAAAARGQSPSWRYITMAELARKMQDFRTDDSKALFDELLAIDILALDELGTVADRTEGGWVTRWLGDLVDTRYRKCLTSLYATNCTVAELQEIIQNDRVVSRLVEGRNRVVITGDDLRTRQTGRIE